MFTSLLFIEIGTMQLCFAAAVKFGDDIVIVFEGRLILLVLFLNSRSHIHVTL